MSHVMSSYDSSQPLNMFVSSLACHWIAEFTRWSKNQDSPPVPLVGQWWSGLPILSYLRRARALSRSTSGCVQVTVSAIATMVSAPFNLISARKLALIMARVYPTYGLLGRRLGSSHMLRLKQTSCLVPNGWSLLLSVLWPPFDLRSPIPVDKVDYILSRTTDI
jgi:hypothetical protein